jgi:hypothetical protein
MEWWKMNTISLGELGEWVLKIPDGIDVGETFRLGQVIRGDCHHERNVSGVQFSPNGIMSADALAVAGSQGEGGDSAMQGGGNDKRKQGEEERATSEKGKG